uniref:PHD-type domain-containing protein n=1 Tax=Vitrella brassicaformis TaxID=1169539 RepID=A0A7S1KGZ1_9ALVE|mmetsp:Transcript_51773/g.129988  ORF Transcript_51773/g.129988 Transcript_51773/m.129988 type:complete len:167 (+) Transcript_51773:312-812(+)
MPFTLPVADSEHCGVCTDRRLRRMVTCSKCFHSFHRACVGIAANAPSSSTRTFVCPPCRDSRHTGILSCALGDVMHNVLEGMLEYEMENILNVWIDHGWLSLADLGDVHGRVQHCEKSSRNRASRITPDSCGATAAARMYLAPQLRILLFESLPQEGSDEREWAIE